MKTNCMKTKEAFYAHFHAQPGIDPSATNHNLIAALFGYMPLRDRIVLQFDALHCSGVTTTLIHWAKWFDVPFIVFTDQCSKHYWRSNGVPSTFRWPESIRGFQYRGTRPQFAILDNPADDKVARSRTLSARYAVWLANLPYPAFHVKQS